MRETEKPIYSICVPTYKRKDQIERLLKLFSGICGGEGNLNKKVEICISDNNETDDTEAVVRRYMAERFLNIQYHRWGKNVGYDRNAMKAVSLASGAFLHLVSDEVSFTQDGLVEILDSLKKSGIDGIYLDPRGKGPLVPKQIRRKLFSLTGVANYYLTFMGTLIMRREICQEFLKQHEEDIGRYEGNAFIHIPFFLYFLEKAERVGFSRIRIDSGKQAVIRPAQKARLYLDHHFMLMKECAATGLLTREEYSRYKRNTLIALPFLMLKIRVYMPPKIYDSEIEDVLREVSTPAPEYGFIGRTWFSIWKIAIFNRIIPYHWIYLAWFWFKTKVRKDPAAVDLFKEYEKSDKEAE